MKIARTPNLGALAPLLLLLLTMIGLAGCTTHPNEDVRKADPATTPIAKSALAGEDEIRPSCEEKWTGDYTMIARCIERHTRGYRDVQRLLEEHNIRSGDTTPEAKIFADCFRKWRSHGPEYTMIARCFERQWAGYKQLYPE